MKRWFDLLVAAVGLFVLSPLLFLVACAIVIDSGWPVFFRQERVGLAGRPFRILKFRTMASRPGGPGLAITVSGDLRVTRLGRLLRRAKLDELPQLWNVVTGDMSLVGPRPEVPKYVACYPDEVRGIVQSVRPGITDDAAIEFVDESDLLAHAADPERAYLDVILPRKLALYVRYVESRTFFGDVGILARTLWRIVAR